MVGQISWAVTKQEALTIAAIAKQAVRLAAAFDEPIDYQQIQMDITACHCNGCRLDLDRLLCAGDGDFGHDVFGIRKNIDRETGELKNCFVPRFAVQK